MTATPFPSRKPAGRSEYHFSFKETSNRATCGFVYVPGEEIAASQAEAADTLHHYLTRHEVWDDPRSPHKHDDKVIAVKVIRHDYDAEGEFETARDVTLEVAHDAAVLFWEDYPTDVWPHEAICELPGMEEIRRQFLEAV